MPLARPTPAIAAVAVLAGLLAAPATAAMALDQELPFTCAEEWTGTTRANHRPSSDSIDFNRDQDLGRLVVASAGGVVSRVEDAGTRSYGKWVEITHPEGYSTLYAHLKAQWVVPGQFVDQGAPIGRVGDTGAVTGAHLHYEQKLAGKTVAPVFHGETFLYGTPALSQNCVDVPLAGDWNGDRADEVAVFRRDAGAGTFEMYAAGAVATPVRFGRASDLPVSGDWDGDGITDVGVRRQGARVFLLRRADGTVTRTKQGFLKDLPVTGDWDGNGTTDVGVYRPRASRFRLLLADGTEQVVRLGGSGSQPVTGDWDGDRVTDLGVFDTATATFSLRTMSSDGYATVVQVPLGSTTDLPVTGDWDGDGVTDVGTWTPGTATYTLRVTPPGPAAARWSSTAAPELRTIYFGRPR
ncbi:MAG TPA: VCBS repeat domain-containing M23 family metallopeptidase [Nocardioidaceae bacterium]|nr:VCBS repeat domain-containing M23 family metallopeptidase [Nocardioidaceae bacterium]